MPPCVTHTEGMVWSSVASALCRLAQRLDVVIVTCLQWEQFTESLGVRPRHEMPRPSATDQTYSHSYIHIPSQLLWCVAGLECLSSWTTASDKNLSRHLGSVKAPSRLRFLRLRRPQVFPHQVQTSPSFLALQTFFWGNSRVFPRRR